MDFTDMTDQELADLQAAAGSELARRQSMDAFEDEIATVIKGARLGGVIEDRGNGEAWDQPTGYHNAYVKGDEVTHNGDLWVSLYSGNDQEPGVRGWRKVLPPDEDGNEQYPVWKMPQGYEEGYPPGAHVWYPDEDGELYVNVHTDKNSWEPGVAHSQWEVTDAPNEE